RLQGVLDALLDRRDVLARNHATLDGVDELEAGTARLERLELDDDVTILAAATRLLDELPFGFLDRLADRFAVGHLRLADRSLDAELALHAIDQDLEMELAHARDDRLAALLVGTHAERRVFLGEARQRDAHLLLVGLGLGLHGLRDDGLGELHALEDDGRVGIAQRLAGGDLLEAHAGGDVARPDFLDLLAVVGAHLQQPSDALLLALDRVEHRVARAEHAREDPD